MNVKPSSGLNQISNAGTNGAKLVPPPKVEEQASFQHSEALNNSLASTPDVRPEVVARAKELASSNFYPPPKVIRQISTLLAIGLVDGENP